MQDTFGSVRRSLVLRSSSSKRAEGTEGGVIDKVGRCLRKSRVGVGFLSKLQKSPTILMEIAPPIRWRKGELIGCGAYGRVYMGMNLNSGELIAVKQVSFASRNASKEKAQAHIRELEEEVKLLKTLSHPNIVRYLGTAREDGSLNIMLEFVPGGSISSLLGKFGSFPEAVIRTYTKQLLNGLEYLHKNGIIHRDIKGANILVDNRGHIKLADFGASKKVVELATISGVNSMKGTPYWMAPEVILQTGHSYSADIWSVGCTVIEMATGKPPWSEQYQEVAALFHIGTTKSHPPIPDHLSLEAKDFLLKCLMKEPNLRPPASDLLQHPFVLGEYRDLHPIFRSPHKELSPTLCSASGSYQKNSPSTMAEPRTICRGLSTDCNISSMRCSNTYVEEGRPILEASKSGDMCLTGVDDDIKVDGTVRTDYASMPDSFNKSFNPISEPLDDWQYKFDESPEPKRMNFDDGYGSVNGFNGASISAGAYAEGENNFMFPCETPEGEDDDEVTELKIRAFLDEKALDLKKLQTPLYEEFYNTSKVSSSPDVVSIAFREDATYGSNTTSRSGLSVSPSRVASETAAPPADAEKTVSSSSCSRSVLSSGSINGQILREIPPSRLNERRGLLDAQQEPNSSSASFSERQRKWKEELDEDLERQREMMRQAGVGRKTSSLKNRGLKRPRERLWSASPSK